MRTPPSTEAWGLLHHFALPQHRALLHRRRRFHLLVVSLERLRSALHHRSRTSEPTTAGFLLGASGLGSFILGFLLPSLSDRLGRKPVLLAMAAMSSLVPLVLLISPLYAYPLTAEQRAQLLGIAEKCPVHRTLKSEIDIRRWLA